MRQFWNWVEKKQVCQGSGMKVRKRDARDCDKGKAGGERESRERRGLEERGEDRELREEERRGGETRAEEGRGGT